MSDLSGLKERLKEVDSLRMAGKFAEARQILESLVEDTTLKSLNQQTSLGIPRQLHSAQMKLAKAQKDVLRSIGYQYHLVPPPELLNKFTQFSSSERRKIAQLNREVVPRIIHQIWIGSMPTPEGTLAWSRHARRHGYDYKLWREADLRAIGMEDNPLYMRLVATGDLPGAVDVARYVVLEKLGGIYLDCDWYPAREDISFHDLLSMHGLTAMAETTPRNTGKGSLLLSNAMLLAPPAHPVFTRLLAALDEMVDALPDAPAWWATGPLVFTLMCRGGSMTLADSTFLAGSVPQDTTLADVDLWCRQAQQDDLGLLLLWKSWVW